MTALFLVVACAALNRFAGGGMWLGELFNPDRPDKLWGRALYPATVGVGLVAAIVVPWTAAAAIALAFIVWRSPAWGRAISLGNWSGAMEREPHPFEATLFRLAGDDPHLALFLRHLVMLVPGLLVVGLTIGLWQLVFAAAPFAMLLTAAYVVAWKATPTAPIKTGEFICGALWGAMIAGLAAVV